MTVILTRKKLTILVVALVLIASIAAGTTLAYYTAEVRTINAVKMGSVDITLTGEELPGEIKPDETIPVKYVVKNTGSRDVYVRLLVQPAVDGDADKFTLSDPADVSWAKGTDGKAYYNGVLKAGESVPVTLPLKTASTVKSGDAFSIKAVAQAVQSDNYSHLKKNSNGNINGWEEKVDGYTLEFEAV